MAVEDLTTYTLSSAGGTIGVTSARATATAFIGRAASPVGYVQKDKGAGHFGDFSHLITVFCSANGISVYSSVWCISTTSGDVNQIGGGNYINVHLYDGLAIYISDGTTEQNYTISASTPYYLTIARTGTAFTCKIYSDSGRTTLLTTLSLTVTTATYRYIGVMQGYSDGANSNTVSGYVENLDLQEGGAAAVTYPQLERGIRGYCRGLAGMN